MLELIFLVLAFIAGYVLCSKGYLTGLYNVFLKPYVDKWFGGSP